MKISVVTVTVALGVAHPAIAQDTLPDGPGKAQVIQLCSACHEPAKATSVKLAKEGWIETIDRMKAFGATGSDEDFAAVLEYLSMHFKGDVVRPLDMNTAEAIDLGSASGRQNDGVARALYNGRPAQDLARPQLVSRVYFGLDLASGRGPGR